MKIIIELVNGQLTVTGDCLNDRIATLGMLETAKHIVMQPQPPRPVAGPIEIPNAALAKHLNGRMG